MQKIVATLDNKKATNIKSLEITELSSVADYFVIATGTSGFPLFHHLLELAQTRVL